MTAIAMSGSSSDGNKSDGDSDRASGGSSAGAAAPVLLMPRGMRTPLSPGPPKDTRLWHLGPSHRRLGKTAVWAPADAVHGNVHRHVRSAL